MKPTKKILKNNHSPAPKIINNIGGWTASVFSVIFSLSIVREYTRQSDNVLLIAVLVAFTVLFLLFNEYIKVRELRKKFNRHNSSLFIIIVTFGISFVMSSVGIFLWTNKGIQLTNDNIHNSVQSKEAIIKQYNRVIDSVSASSYNLTPEYNRLNDELKWWKRRVPVDLVDRHKISQNIERIQQDIVTFRGEYETLKNEQISSLNEQKNVELESLANVTGITTRNIRLHNFITIVFLLMVAMTELLIIFLAREYSRIKHGEDKFRQRTESEYFYDVYRVLTDVLLRKNSIDLNDIRYSVFNRSGKEGWKFIKDTIRLYDELGIKEGVSLSQAQTKLRQYFDTVLNL